MRGRGEVFETDPQKPCRAGPPQSRGGMPGAGANRFGSLPAWGADMPAAQVPWTAANFNWRWCRNVTAQTVLVIRLHIGKRHDTERDHTGGAPDDRPDVPTGDPCRTALSRQRRAAAMTIVYQGGPYGGQDDHLASTAQPSAGCGWRRLLSAHPAARPFGTCRLPVDCSPCRGRSAHQPRRARKRPPPTSRPGRVCAGT